MSNGCQLRSIAAHNSFDICGRLLESHKHFLTGEQSRSLKPQLCVELSNGLPPVHYVPLLLPLSRVVVSSCFWFPLCLQSRQPPLICFFMLATLYSRLFVLPAHLRLLVCILITPHFMGVVVGYVISVQRCCVQQLEVSCCTSACTELRANLKAFACAFLRISFSFTHSFFSAHTFNFFTVLIAFKVLTALSYFIV